MFDEWSDGRVFSLVEDAHRQAAVGMARKLAGIVELLDRRTAEELDRHADMSSMISAFRGTVAEVGAVLNISSYRARTLVRHADALHTRVPAVGALLAAGECDWDTVELVLTRTDLVDEDLVGRVDAVVADKIGRWSRWSRKHIVNAIDAEVKRIDPEAAKKRRVAAYDARNVSVEVGLDGTATVRATMSAEEGVALLTRLTAMAKAVCAGDPRTLSQRRLDAMTALHHGQVLACACSNPSCPARTPTPAQQPATADAQPAAQPAPDAPDAPTEQPATAPTEASTEAPSVSVGRVPPALAGRTVVLNVIAPAETVNGYSDAPGYLVGYGIIDAELVRELAREATRRLVEEPVVEERQALRYRPSAALARFIRARDLTCRFPGCGVPAEHCDIDHTEPFNHDDPAAGGATVPWNLACYCREHHRVKTFDDGWRDHQHRDGTIVWTSPAGKTMTTAPGGVALFPGLARRRSPAEHERVAAARRRLRTHRDTSSYNQYRNRAAKEEVRLRCWRNQSRRFYVLFKGESTQTKPSTSPFARFINDPIEPETLPRHWQPPPPQNPTEPDEPPPF